jgi:hypothetical protein
MMPEKLISELLIPDQARHHFPIREQIPDAGIRKFLIFLMNLKSCGILQIGSSLRTTACHRR